MSSTDTKPVELRESWRPREDTGRGAEAKRWGRRLAYLTLLIALSALLLYLLFSPFWHPYPHWYFVGGQSQPAPQLPVIQEPEADFAALNDSLQLRYYAGQRGGPLRRVQVETRTDLAELADDLSSMSLGQSDILIVYLTAYGLSVDGEAFLLWQADTETGTNVIRYPLEQLLQQVAAWTSGIKLLLLDMGHEPYAPRWGMTISEVQELLCQQVADLDDPSVWVLTANSSMEQSYRRPADGKSYFGSAVSSALAGEGDLNDDLMIDLDELFRFVRVQVQQDVKRDSDGLAEQTPTLLRGGQGEVTKAESVVRANHRPPTRMLPHKLPRLRPTTHRRALDRRALGRPMRCRRTRRRARRIHPDLRRCWHPCRTPICWSPTVTRRYASWLTLVGS
jgi:hypothetical protein